MFLRQNLILPAVILVLTACGGGGGGGSSPPPQPPATPTPRAVNDTARVDEDSGETLIDVLENDTLIDDDTLEITTGPANGLAEVVGTNVSYAPNANYHGNDSLTYSVTGTNGSTLSATLNITVLDINDPPLANDDSVTLIEDTPTTVPLTMNDSDPDGSINNITIVDAPVNGSVVTESGIVTYTPSLDYTGVDEFTYRAEDDDGAESNLARVTINIEAVVTTELTVTNLTVAETGYTSANNAEFNADVLTSPQQTLVIPPNTVSFLLTLQGEQVGAINDALFIPRVQSPSESLTSFRGTVGFCDGHLCSSLIPRRPEITAERGNWHYQLGTLNGTLDDIELGSLTLRVAVRTGPNPDLSTAFPAAIKVRTFLTNPEVTDVEMNAVITRFGNIASLNGIRVDLAPTVVIEDVRFSEISPDFTESTTSELVSMGEPDAVNFFFVEGFTGANGGSILGIASGIPGPLGQNNPLNGVLINSTIFHDSTQEFFIRNTAQIAFHEMGHHLGLYHTTEGDFSFNDVLDDTPDCLEGSHDANDNGLAESNECPDGNNPMFWTPPLLSEFGELSGDQQKVIYFSPIAIPTE